MGVHGKHGKLPATLSDTCALCRLIVATASHLQTLRIQPLRSYNVLFQRLIKPGDVGVREVSKSSGDLFSLPVTIQASENETIVQDIYTESTRKPLVADAQKEGQVLQYRTYTEPCRSAIFCTRLHVGTDRTWQQTANSEPQHLQMLAVESSQVKQWITRIAQTCSEQHEVCGKSLLPGAGGSSWASFSHPIRLVRFDGSNGHPKAKLVEMDAEIPNYACVSHRWWGDKQWKTSKETIDDAFENIPFESLPKTFQDSAIVAQSLGVNHLWIDSICIIQDDKVDWEQQSKQMGLIFQRSSYALAAIDAFSEGDTDSGLLLTRDEMPTKVTIRSSFSAQFDKVLAPLASQPAGQNQDEDEPQTEFDDKSSAAWQNLNYKLEHEYTSFDMSVERSPWNSRGWIFQERLLSPRMLYFTKEQVFWECAAGIVSQSTEDWAQYLPVRKGGLTSSGTLATSGASLHQLLRMQESAPTERSDEPWSYGWKEHKSLQLWWRITERYSTCALTFTKDRWFAIAGLCDILQDRYHAEIYAGIWNVGVGAGLLWHARNSYLRPFDDFSAPSWSWLNLEGPIGYAYDDIQYSGCIQKVFTLIQHHSFDVETEFNKPDGLHHGFTGKLLMTCPTGWAIISSVKFADFQFREMTGQTTAMPAWRFFQTASKGRCAVELAREYRSMGLPGMTRLLYSNITDEKTNDGLEGSSAINPQRAIGWAVLDRDMEPEGPVLCAYILRRDLYGAKALQQQVIECILLVQDEGSAWGDMGKTENIYRRIGRGRIVENGFSSNAKVDTISMI